jgi:hypothetical protein
LFVHGIAENKPPGLRTPKGSGKVIGCPSAQKKTQKSPELTVSQEPQVLAPPNTMAGYF